MPALGNKIDGFVAINRYIPIFQGPLDTPYLHRFFDDAKARLAEVDLSGPLPDRYVQSNYEAMNALKVAMVASKFEGRDDTDKLIEALEGLEIKEGDDFPQGDKTLRKADHQAFLREFLYVVEGGSFKLLEQGQNRLSAGLQFCGLSPRDRRPIQIARHSHIVPIWSRSLGSVFSQTQAQRRRTSEQDLRMGRDDLGPSAGTVVAPKNRVAGAGVSRYRARR